MRRFAITVCRKGQWKMMVKIKAAGRVCWYRELVFYLVRSTIACMESQLTKVSRSSAFNEAQLLRKLLKICVR